MRIRALSVARGVVLDRSTSRPRGRWVTALSSVAVVAAALAGCAPEPAEPPPSTAGDLAAAVDRYVAESLSPGIRNRRAIVVAVDGRTVVERYYGSDAQETADVASVTKSIVSTLVGIAVSEGLLSLEDTLAEMLPSHAGRMTAPIGAITLRELLTMTAGLPADDGEDLLRSGDDWVARILERATSRPRAEGFAYSNASSHLLATIVTEATGRPLLAWARQKLFDPLGIDTRPAFQPVLAPGRTARTRAYDDAGFAWPRDPQGVNLGFGTVKLTAEDMLKLGTLYLDGGRWDGEQLVPSQWVEEATSPAVRTAGDLGGSGYGYQWWVTSAGEHEAAAAVGYGGQIIEVVPDLDLVVVASTWIDETASLDSRIWQVMTSMAIAPVLEPDAS